MHGARAVAGGGPVGAAGQRAVVDGSLSMGLVRAHLHEPLDRAAVQLDLVDRLAGADLAQLRGPVGGQHDQRHACVPGFDHRRVEVGRGGARGAGDDHRAPARLRHAKGEEAGAALVQDGHRPELGPAGEREGQRRVARPRRRDRVAQPATHQLVDERLHRRVGPVDGLHGAGRYPAVDNPGNDPADPLHPRLHAARRRLGRRGRAARPAEGAARPPRALLRGPARRDRRRRGRGAAGRLLARRPPRPACRPARPGALRGAGHGGGDRRHRGAG